MEMKYPGGGRTAGLAPKRRRLRGGCCAWKRGKDLKIYLPPAASSLGCRGGSQALSSLPSPSLARLCHALCSAGRRKITGQSREESRRSLRSCLRGSSSRMGNMQVSRYRNTCWGVVCCVFLSSLLLFLLARAAIVCQALPWWVGAAAEGGRELSPGRGWPQVSRLGSFRSN